ncbi:MULTISPECIES: response regulator [Allobacillus]|uniref:Response regulator n=1 Tax=Allobacillus salarius TaxID=1955272 RepID=A0A556PGS3_9BACI|nr:response regulator [Allobacillus salarius]TSJ63573.1 response regulator [Allobacillus salarius]
MKSILVDDEKLALEYLENQLIKTKQYEIIGKFTNPLDAKRIIDKHKVDVLFLDIEMPRINGIEFAEKLLEDNPELQIVFVTAYNEYAVQAFELNAVDYLLKPIKLERLHKTTARLNSEITEHTKEMHDKIQIHLCYEPKILEGNQEVPLKWRTYKAQQVFYYLIHCRNRIVAKEELIEILWPYFELEKANAQLYTTIYQVRRTLKSLINNIKIVNIGEGYKIELKNVALDIEIFERFIEKNEPMNENTISQYEKVIQLVDGDYLQGFDYTWIDYEQTRLRFLTISTKSKMIQWYRETSDIDSALKHAYDIYQRYPLEEEGYFELMKTFAVTKDSKAVKKYYNELKLMLEKELAVEPSFKIQHWYNDWIQNFNYTT